MFAGPVGVSGIPGTHGTPGGPARSSCRGTRGWIMTQPTEQFAELTRRGHQLFAAALSAWDDAARSLAEAARRPQGGLPDVRASVDAAFDFAARMLADQREFTKVLMTAGTRMLGATAQRAAPDFEPEPEPAPDHAG